MAIVEQPHDPIARWIEPHPWKPGAGEARLRDSKVAVWALIGDLPMAGNDVAAVADGYHVPVEAVEAAIRYYRQHEAEINARLAANGTPVPADGALARAAS